MDSISDLSVRNFIEEADTQYYKGLEKYGTVLTPFNKRDAYTDAMQELVDLANYLTQLEIEYREVRQALLALCNHSDYNVVKQFVPSEIREALRICQQE